MLPCTVVLRRQLPAALRLAERWAALHPLQAAPFLVLVADGDAETLRTLGPGPGMVRVTDPRGIGMSRPLSSLLRLLHRAADAPMAFGPWAMAAALDAVPDGMQDGTPDGVAAVLIDVRVELVEEVTDGPTGLAALSRRGRIVTTADGALVAADRRAVAAWQRRSVWSASSAPPDLPPGTDSWWMGDAGMGADSLWRALVEQDSALVTAPRHSMTTPLIGVRDDRPWWSQRDGTPLPELLRTLSIAHLGAHLDVAEPQWSPYAPSVRHGVDQLPRDLLAGTPRDLRVHGTIRAQRGAPPPPPDPFGPDPGAYRAWLAEPVTPHPFPVSRAVADIHRRRPDLHEEFADLANPAARRGLLEWAATVGGDDGRLPPWLVPGRPEPGIGAGVGTGCDALHTGSVTRGVLVSGYLDAALGLGEAGRLMVRALELGGEPVATRTYRHLISPTVAWRDRPVGTGAMDINMFCLNGSELPRFVASAGPALSRARYRIGLWFWEAERLSAAMLAGFPLVDEIWVTSEFTAGAVRADAPASMPVLVMPLGVDAPDAVGDRGLARSRARHELDLPQGWLTGFSFDHGSMVARKNPVGLIEAWQRAFPTPSTGPHAPHLVVKSMNGDGHQRSSQLVRNTTGGRPDITVVDRTFSPAEQHLFIAGLDCYASLHRSEGYGLLMLEAMAVGTPVMATGATGNLAFMTPSNSWLVPAAPIRLNHAAGPYPAGSLVHEPDLDAAAVLLRELYQGRDDVAVRARVDRARSDVRGLADGTTAAHWVRRRLAELRAALGPSQH